MAEIVPDLTKLQFTDYNGTQVRAGDQYKTELADGAAQWNKVTGQNLTAEAFDRKINGNQADARWGATAGVVEPGKSGVPGNTAGNGLLGSSQTNAYATTDVKVGPESTVQGQIANITGTGSALNTQAETSATKMAAQRGLLNSSIAVGAAQDAVLKSALPIAQQDANTYANAASTNAQQKTAASQFTASSNLQQKLAQIQADTSLTIADKQIASAQVIANSQIASQQGIADKDNATKLQLQTIDTETKKMLSTLDTDAKAKAAQIEADNKQLLQTNISAANAYAQLAEQLATISTSTTMDAAAKQQATDNQLNVFRSTLQALGQVSGLNLSKYYESLTAPVPATPTSADVTSGRPGMNGSQSEFG